MTIIAYIFKLFYYLLFFTSVPLVFILLVSTLSRVCFLLLFIIILYGVILSLVFGAGNIYSLYFFYTFMLIIFVHR